MTFLKVSRRGFTGAFFMSISAFFLLCGYEFARSASYTIFKASYGSSELPYAMALIPVVVVIMLYIYGKLISLFGPRKTLLITAFFSSLIMAVCYFSVISLIKIASLFLFPFREAYVVLLIEEYWSFLNSTLTKDEAKKLNGFIIGISSLGDILGGFLVSKLAVPLGTEIMVLFAALLILPSAFFSDLAYKFCGEPKKTDSKSGSLGLELFKTSRLLTSILILILLTQLIATVLDLNFQSILVEKISDKNEQTAYMGGLFALLNTIAAFLQFVVSPLLLKYIPLFVIHLSIPLIHLLSISFAIFYPSLFSAAFSFLIFKAFDYSIFRAAKEILYIPLSFDARFRAKEVIDVFGYRFGKGIPSLIIILLKNIGVSLVAYYALVGLASSFLWFLFIPFMFHKEKK